jgi:hypothetical protein
MITLFADFEQILPYISFDYKIIGIILQFIHHLLMPDSPAFAGAPQFL